MFDPILPNPLLSEDPATWDRLIEAVGPASVLCVIDHRLGDSLRRFLSAEDVFQEALLRAWRTRASLEWRSVRAFRSLLLTIIDHCIRDAADHYKAAKRGGGRPIAAFSALQRGGAGDSTTSIFAGPISSTAPSRAALCAEQAAAMRAALELLPDALREVTRLRLFEQQSMEAIAAAMDLGVSAVRHRVRQGVTLYPRLLQQTLASSSVKALERPIADEGDTHEHD